MMDKYNSSGQNYFKTPGTFSKDEQLSFLERLFATIKHPDISNFKHVLSENKADDLKKISSLVKKFENKEEREIEKTSSLFEKFIIESQNLGWFKDCKMQLSSIYDDFCNKTDIVVEWKTEDEKLGHLALAIDITIDTGKRLEDKLKTFSDKMLRNEATELKYHRSLITQEENHLKEIVPAVFGLSGGNATNLLKDFADLKALQIKRTLQNEEKLELEKLNNRIINHPAQKMFVEQILFQIGRYKENEKIKPALLVEIEKIENKMNALLQNINQNFILDKQLSEALKNDACYTTIKNFNASKSVDLESVQSGTYAVKTKFGATRNVQVMKKPPKKQSDQN